MTGTDINKKLESFSNLINEFANNNFTGKELWNRKKEIDENFKAAQFENADDKTAAIQKFESLVNSIAIKEKEIEQANEQFTTQAEALIQTFETNAKQVLAQEEISKDDFKKLREETSILFEYFKQQRWTTKERRTTAWDIYANLRNDLKAKEDDLFSKEREVRSKQISQSLEITEKICVVVNACHPSLNVEELQKYVVKFNEFLSEANLQEHNKTWFLIEKPEDVKFSLKSRTETLNDVRNFVSNYKEFLTREHKGQIFANIDSLKDDLNKAWDNHKVEQQKRQEEWELKKKERDEKRIEWHKKQQDFLFFLEGRLQNQISYKAKQEDYVKNQKEFAKRFENRIPAQQEYIKKLIEQVIDLEKKYATAWTDSFKTKVEEWIKEKKEKIASVEADIEVLKAKVADINKGIDEMPKRIEELDASIIEIQEKIVEVKIKLENDVLPTNNEVENIEPKVEETITEIVDEVVKEQKVEEPIIESTNTKANNEIIAEN